MEALCALGDRFLFPDLASWGGVSPRFDSSIRSVPMSPTLNPPRLVPLRFLLFLVSEWHFSVCDAAFSVFSELPPCVAIVQVYCERCHLDGMAPEESAPAYVGENDAPGGLRLGGIFDIFARMRWADRPFRRAILFG